MTTTARVLAPWRSALALGCALVMLSACNRQGAQGRDATIRATVERWLTCEECVAGERDSVRALGAEAVPLLRAALQGPPDSVIANMSRSSVDAYARVRRQFERMTPAERALRPIADSVSFVSRNVENFRATYRTRAAIALNDIDPAAARALFAEQLRNDSAGVRPLTPELRRLLDSLARVP